jgi:serine/threonine protein phosphatase PrpC
MQTVNHAVRTDVGKARNHNEDSYRVNADLGLYVLADGMGGHASGEVASEIAVKTIEQQVKRT